MRRIIAPLFLALAIAGTLASDVSARGRPRRARQPPRTTVPITATAARTMDIPATATATTAPCIESGPLASDDAAALRRTLASVLGPTPCAAGHPSIRVHSAVVTDDIGFHHLTVEFNGATIYVIGVDRPQLFRNLAVAVRVQLHATRTATRGAVAAPR